MKVGRDRVGGRRRQRISIEYGGDERIRTADLLSAIQALSQLSYVPTAAAEHSSRRFAAPETPDPAPLAGAGPV